ncbi:MAG TPA: transcriptional regulator PtsJ [Buttiauxella sp.]
MIIGNTAGDIFDSVRHLIQTGGLKPGELLPPVRELALQLNVNRNTVASAYKRLVTSGLAISQGRNGTQIKDMHPPVELEGGSPNSPLIDLSSGNPALARLPEARRYFSQLAGTPRLYGDPAVDAQLEAWAQNWMSNDLPGKGEINITSGAIDAIERLLQTHLLPGDSVAVEDPCFLSSINMLRCTGFAPSPVAIDEEGMQLEALEQALKSGARALILTPRAHNPTGCSLSQRRAAAIRTLLSRYPQVMIIVDDHFALLSHSPFYPVIPAETQRWALVRSLSKALGPDLRLALVACDRNTSDKLRLRLNSGSQWVSHLLQDLALACVSDPAFQATLEQARLEYQRLRESMVEAFHEKGIGEVKAGDGLNIWLPTQAPSQALALELARAGWLVREGEVFGITSPAHGIRITVSELTQTDIEKLAADTRRALDKL